MDLTEHLKKALKELGFNAGAGPQTPPPQEPVQDERLAALEAENARLREAQAQVQASLAQQEAQNLALEQAARRERLERRVEDLRQSVRLSPAAADLALTLAESNPDALEAALPVMEANAPNAQILGGGVDANQLRTDNTGADGDRLHNLAQAYAKENKVTYGVALSAVSRQNPELAASVAAPNTPPLEEAE
jgi:hypothetical protein